MPADDTISAYRMQGLACLCGNLRMAARALTHVYDAHLEACGLTANQLAVLWCVVASLVASIINENHLMLPFLVLLAGHAVSFFLRLPLVR